MRILVLTSTHLMPSDPYPGAGLFFANLLLRLRQFTEQIVVVSPNAYVPNALGLLLPQLAWHRRVLAHQWWNGLEIHRPHYLSLGSLPRMWSQARNFCTAALSLCTALHRRHRFDIVIGYGFGPAAHAAQCISKSLNLRSVCWAIGSDVHTVPFMSNENMRLFQHNTRYCDMVLCESEALRQSILHVVPNAGHVHTYYKGIDLGCLAGLADQASIRAKLGLSRQRRYVISVGAVKTSKGVHEFYAALKRLFPRYTDLSAIWLGNGSELDSLRKKAQAESLTDRLLLPGQVCRENVLEYMRAADVMAFPSHAEGLPNVVMEAMATGLPTISTDVGGVNEVISPAVTGMLVPPHDSNALASAIEFVLSHPLHARQMAETGRDFIRQYFDVDRNAHVLVDTLAKIASGGSTRDPICAAAGLPPGILPIRTVA